MSKSLQTTQLTITPRRMVLCAAARPQCAPISACCATSFLVASGHEKIRVCGHLKRSLIADVGRADKGCFRRYAGSMRYAQGGGLTAEGRRRREQVRLAAVERFERRV